MLGKPFKTNEEGDQTVVRQCFPNMYKFREILTEYAMCDRYNICKPKNLSYTIIAKCSDPKYE